MSVGPSGSRRSSSIPMKACMTSPMVLNRQPTCRFCTTGRRSGRAVIVRLSLDTFETGLLIEASRGGELALRPQRQLLVARLAREPDALVDEALADAETPRPRVDEQ